jgi:hypothetical protein
MLTDICRSRIFLALLTATLAQAATPVIAASAPEGTGGIMKPGPDIEAAVRAEFELAESKGTREAYERFIRRHPDHALADKAREILARGEAK